MMFSVTTERRDMRELAADGLMTVDAARRFLGVSRSTLYKLMNEGAVPYVQLRGVRRIPRAALVEFVAQNMRFGRSA